MKLGIMQPYFFPYLGYLDLINRADQWVVFDRIQYIRHGWVNRNRILHPESGWQYIIVPVKKHSRATTIDQIVVSDHADWRGRILGQLGHYKKHAPFYDETVALVAECLSYEDKMLCTLNVKILERICRKLAIPFQYKYFSELQLSLGDIEEPGDWALEISKAMGATEYVNPPGGADIFDHRKFEEENIVLTIQQFSNLEYSCKPYSFIPGLSIVDVLMWNSRERIRAHLGKLAHRSRTRDLEKHHNQTFSERHE